MVSCRWCFRNWVTIEGLEINVTPDSSSHVDDQDEQCHASLRTRTKSRHRWLKTVSDITGSEALENDGSCGASIRAIHVPEPRETTDEKTRGRWTQV